MPVSQLSLFYVVRACLLNVAVVLWTFPRLEHGIACLSSGATCKQSASCA